MMDPSRTALLNIDMQNCFLVDSPVAVPDGLEVLERINTLAAACRSAGVLVVHVAIVLRPGGANAGLLADSPLVQQGIIDRGRRSAALHEALVVEASDILLEKPTFGAFYGTDLELILRTRGIETVIVSGVATNVCCDTTAREAFVRGFRVLFLSDATATFPMGDLSPEDLQKATCATIGAIFGRVLSTEELLAELAPSKPAVSRVRTAAT